MHTRRFFASTFVALTLLTWNQIAQSAGQSGTASFHTAGYRLNAVSADGTAAAGAGIGGSGILAIRWTVAGGVQVLGDVPGGSEYSEAHGISSDGNVVVGTGTIENAGAAFRWTAATGLVELQGGSCGGGAKSTSGDGLVTGGFIQGGEDCIEVNAARWTGTGAPSAFPVVGEILGASQDGSVLAGVVDIRGPGGPNNRPARWVGQTSQILASTFGWAFDVSANGQVIVGVTIVSGASTAFRWTEAAGLSSVPVNAAAAAALGVSGDGSRIVGRYNATSESPSRAFIWDEHFGFRDLKEYLTTEYGLNIGINLHMALDISPDGLAIVGAGGADDFFPNQGWIVRLPGGDADADGLLDTWESENQGIDVDGDGTIDLDLYALGARPDHKDLFIEIDAMTGRAPGNLAPVIQAFANAPVVNPDGSTGITLHLHIDDLDVPLGSDWPVNQWPPQFDNLKPLYFGTAIERNDPNSIAILDAKRKAFRYCIYADTSLNHAAGGIARTIHCNDFIVFKGEQASCSVCAASEQSTFMHELGHALGLGHGGGDFINLKPNYISVMNYLYQLTPPGDPDHWRLDYSRGTSLPIFEDNIDESVMLQALPGDPNIGVLTYYAPAPCEANPCRVGPSNNTIPNSYIIGSGVKDFNVDGQVSTGVCMDLNHYGPWFPMAIGRDPSPCEVLSDHNDWASIRLPLVSEEVEYARGGSPPVEMTIAEMQMMATFLPPPPCIADVSGDGFINVVDLLAVINTWGACAPLPSLCGADIAPLPVDRHVNVADLLTVINAWGPCP